MGKKIGLKLAGALFLLALGNSFPAMASHDEKDPKDCEERLTETAPAEVEFQLEAELPADQADQPVIHKIGDRELNMDFITRWRVRIMPVGQEPEEMATTFFFSAARADLAAWTEARGNSDQSSLMLSRADSLQSPAFSFPLESGETVKAYQSLPGSEANGYLAALTSRRILLFKYSSH